MAVSVRTRFEVFKRDAFTCRYCGQRSPDVVLEVDHIVPVCEGGTDDEMNLATSCWDCNRGKSGQPLAEIMTGEDPHDKAVLLLERERQLREYNSILAAVRERYEQIAYDLYDYWHGELCRCNEIASAYCAGSLKEIDFRWLRVAVEHCPSEQIKTFMDLAISKGLHKNLKYVGACVRNWRYENAANVDMGRKGVE